MPRVIHDRDGAGGGQVPVESNVYTPGAIVNEATTAPAEQTDAGGNSLNNVTGSQSG